MSSYRNCPVEECPNCGEKGASKEVFKYHQGKGTFKLDHWHCRKCNYQIDEPLGSVDEPSIADMETWMKL